MFKSGVVSVSFRPNGAEEIVEAVTRANLSVIEWGGDVHCPAGDVETAKRVCALSKASGVELLTYGSYYRIGVTPVEDFSGVLACAAALGVKIVRVWGFNKYIPECSGEVWDKVVAEAKQICDMALSAGVKLCLECHNNTVTENYESTLRFIEAVGSPALGTYWQYNERKSKEYNMEAARALAPLTECIHVFNHNGDGSKAPLGDGLEKWRDYLSVFAKIAKEKTLPVLLEFMPDNKIETLAREAASLNELIASV